MRDRARVQFLRFCLVGVANTGITYLTFLLLYRVLSVAYVPAAVIGYVAGLGNSYLMNRSWTFRGWSDRSPGEIARFLLVNAVSLGANVGVLRLLVEHFRLPAELAQIPAIGVSVVLNFWGNRLWAFRAGRRDPGEEGMFGGWTRRRMARPELWLLGVGFLLSFGLKVSTLGAGGPQTEIDDYTLYEGGFLAWYGIAPTQHGYLETWIAGLASLGTYAARVLSAGGAERLLDVNLIASAYRDFYLAPDSYYHVHRALILLLDMLTAFLIFLLARRVLGKTLGGYGAVIVSLLYLFSFNTFWCNLRGRPDPLLSLAAVAGIYLYLKSEARPREPSFWLAGVCLGLGAGLKLHGAFFAVFAALDILRRRGVREGLKGAALLAAIAFFFFLVSDGVLLFDPLLYVKGRWLTYHADLSPHLAWGRQFLVMLRGSGWLVLPLTLAGAVMVYRERPGNAGGDNESLRSIALIAVLWLLLFGMIRPLRAYWMLPVLPLLYIMAVHALGRVRPSGARAAVLAALGLIFVIQSYAEVRRARTVELDELRQWICRHVPQETPFYIIGHSVVRLPQSTRCMGILRGVYEGVMAQDCAAGMPFTQRHMKHWEEASRLRLFDMLDNHSPGYHFFCYTELPYDRFPEAAALDSFEYLMLQEGYDMAQDPEVQELLARGYVKVGEARSEGMQGRGLLHEIYRKR